MSDKNKTLGALTAIEVTRLTKSGGALTKKLHLTEKGELANDASQCRMARGELERIRLDDWRKFAPLIEKTPRNGAWALGCLSDGLPDVARLVLKDDPQASAPGFIARTQSNFLYRPGAPGLVLLDFDAKGMPGTIKARIEELGGFAAALEAACPAIASAGYIRRRSTSANITNGKTGEEHQSAGEHIFLLVADGADARRFLYALHDRAWLAGLGWHLVGRAGQLLERSIVDRMVCAPERIVFEAPPDLEPPLKQRPRKAIVHDGPPIDTLAARPELSTRERGELERLKAVAADALQGKAAAAETAFVNEQIAKAVARGVDPLRARETARAWGRGVLRPGVELAFDDPAIGIKTVADVLADPAKFAGETLADPIEGVPYGRNCAIVQSRPDGQMQIYSFAHGGAIYRLVHDADSLEAAIKAAPREEATKVLFGLIGRADVDADDAKRLCKIAGARSGGGTRVAERMVADALAEQRKAAARERRERNLLFGGKPRLPAPLADAEARPVMETWNDILAYANVQEPPMRDVEGWPVAIRQREIAGLHEVTAAGANDEEGDEKTRLPSPKHFLLTKHDVYSLEIELSDYITFVEETKDGEREVGAPFRLLTHWLKYRQSKLPTVRAAVTMPLVLANGELMSGAGLNRKLGVVFRIDPALARHIPKREDCTPIAVAKAYRYLTDEWLVDVAADLESKAVLIAYALSIIERILFPERPTFYVTAGQRGNGKTTVIVMITLAVQGVRPAAMAWSSDPDERKKALFAVLREGAPSLIYDNVPRGAVIACPHIERASTTELYKDRVLGVSETPTAPAFTIIAFTGNNIRPKSDTASRSLIARLTTDRVDPENRPFAHDDPAAWTLDHRGEILGALYTILLGNPRLDPKSEPQTRFKAWWRLVGSAVENAVHEATGLLLSFKELFERVEADDEEAVSRADILKTLHAMAWPTRDAAGDAVFTTADLNERLKGIAAQVRNGEPEEPEMAELRRFCTAPKASAPSPKAITRALKAVEGTPTAVGSAVMTLRVQRDSYTKATTFKVVKLAHEGEGGT